MGQRLSLCCERARENKGLAAHEAQERMDALPFQAADLKATLGQISESQKALKLSMPKAAAAPKKRAKAADDVAPGHAEAHGPPSKRRRTKGA